jgi:alkanesulfonate monooxygenase SsuD/methylene tetrahydromethanopterin reductase-like flavin-dependent oxidoreductase (luciferase family)
MRLGVVILPEQPWEQAAELWRAAEEMGFSHAWTYDHLAWAGLRDEPWFGAVPVLTAAATVTSRIRLGPLVASPNFRHPVSLAREVLALDDISAGRLTLGIGAGGLGWDATILGGPAWNLDERLSRFEEFVTLLDRVLVERETSFPGRYYRAEEARSYPGCRQRPRVPFALAGTGPRGMRTVARFGQAWVTTGPRGVDRPLDATAGARVVAEQLALLASACEEVGRPEEVPERVVLAGPGLDQGLASPQQLTDTLGTYAAVGVTDFVVHWPRSSDPYRGDRDHFEKVISSVSAGS